MTVARKNRGMRNIVMTAPRRQGSAHHSRLRRVLVRLATCGALAWLGGAGPTLAQEERDGFVRCQSKDMARVHCPMDTSRGVDLVRQLSEQPCIREAGWGVDQYGVWVALGCRAEFRARPADAAPDDAPRRRVVRCESSGSKRSCAVSLRGAPVRLLHQLSAWPCRRGESWGVGRNEVWVARGCKGEFEIGDREAGFPPGPRHLLCESKGRARRFCGITIEHGASMVRQLSGTPCEEGRTWGWDGDGVWVTGGCRAEFRVD